MLRNHTKGKLCFEIMIEYVFEQKSCSNFIQRKLKMVSLKILIIKQSGPFIKISVNYVFQGVPITEWSCTHNVKT